MKDYNSLKPGLYLQVGDSLKTLSDGKEYLGSFAEALGGGSNANPSVETLAAEVAWVWIALQKRRQKIQEIPYSWQQGAEDIEKAPFTMKHKELIQQIDSSLQIHGEAFLLKRRAGAKMTGVRWLDPVTIRPDYDTANPDEGITRYWREVGMGQRVAIPAKDIIRFLVPGLRELKPDTAAVRATTLAGQILRGIGQSIDVFYDNNALPIMLVKVPSSTSEPERTALQNAFRRLFNGRRGTTSVRTRAVRSDVEVTPLSFKPSDLAMDTLSDRERDVILAAHDIPITMVLTGSATYENANADTQNIITALGSRLEYIAEVYNEDPDFMTAGYYLDIRTSDHSAMKEDESERAGAFNDYRTGGFTPKAAAWLVGISEDDFPKDIGEIFEEKQEIPPQLQQANQQQPPMNNQNDMGNMESQQNNPQAAAEMKSFSKWLKKRAEPNPDDFEAYYMTPEEKEMVYYQVMGERIPDPFERWAEAIKQLNEPVLVGENGHNESS